MSIFEKAQQLADATPGWANWLVIGGSWLVAVIIPVLQAIAFLVTIAWGGLQIYGWFEKRWLKGK